MKENTVEIDVLDLLKKVWAKKFAVLIIGVLAAFLAYMASSLFITPQYDATTRIYVVNANNEGNLSVQDVQLGNYLVNDYREIITSQAVINQVISDNNLSETTRSLSSKLSVSIPTDTRVISITVRESDPNTAANLANAIREVAAAKIREVTKVEDVSVLEVAEPPVSPSTPNTRRNTILAFIAGAGATVAFILVAAVLDDRIKRPEDIEDVLGLPLLGIVPNIDKLR